MMHPFQEKEGKNQAKNPKSDKDTAVPSEEAQTYGIDHLNIGEPVNDLVMTPNYLCAM